MDISFEKKWSKLFIGTCNCTLLCLRDYFYIWYSMYNITHKLRFLKTRFFKVNVSKSTNCFLVSYTLSQDMYPARFHISLDIYKYIMTKTMFIQRFWKRFLLWCAQSSLSGFNTRLKIKGLQEFCRMTAKMSTFPTINLCKKSFFVPTNFRGKNGHMQMQNWIELHFIHREISIFIKKIVQMCCINILGPTIPSHYYLSKNTSRKRI